MYDILAAQYGFIVRPTEIGVSLAYEVTMFHRLKNPFALQDNIKLSNQVYWGIFGLLTQYPPPDRH